MGMKIQTLLGLLSIIFINEIHGASISFVSSRGALGANDSIAWNQLGLPLSFPTLPANLVSANGLISTLSSTNTIRVLVQNTPQIWNGLFSIGDNVLAPYGLFSLSFANPIRGLGADIHHDWLNLTATATMEAFDINNVSLGSLTLDTNWSSTAARGQGTALFFGLVSESRNISRITLQSVAPVPSPDRFGNATKFAINDLSLLTTDPTNSPVPEPSTTACVFVGASLLLCVRLKFAA